MRWQAPSDRVQMILLSPVLIPAVVVLYPIVALATGWEKLRERLAPSKDWHPWFAWRPVRHYNDVDWMWLEKIERAWRGSGVGCVYRLSNTNPGATNEG